MRSSPALEAPALMGLAGDVVRTIAPETEADPAALLLTYFTYVGTALGRTCHYRVEAARHHGNLYVAIVGASSRARKGTSRRRIEQVMEHADAGFVRDRVVSGLSSGEGIIHHLRDQDSVTPDKRLLVTEEELSSALRVMRREGSTLSAVVRSAWDSGRLQTLTKNTPLVASDTHIAILGHITTDELRRELTQTDAANGFANRFLFVHATRSQLLPDGGSLPAAALGELGRRTAEALAFGRGLGEVSRDDATRARWREVYPVLVEERLGLYGAVTGRAEAQVTRLALLYAVLDHAPCIQLAHLEAALAVWRYCEASARLVFGEATGDPVVDRLLALLAEHPNGISRSDIGDAFNRHQPEAVSQGLTWLEQRGKATCRRRQTAGRPVTLWSLITLNSRTPELNETGASTGVPCEISEIRSIKGGSDQTQSAAPSVLGCEKSDGSEKRSGLVLVTTGAEPGLERDIPLPDESAA